LVPTISSLVWHRVLLQVTHSPIQLHQHYGLEFHLVLHNNACIRRGCWSATQLERGLEGLRSCVLDGRRELPLPDKLEPCFRALPLLYWFTSPCDCELCRPVRMIRWLRKIGQWALHDQRDICNCTSNHVEMLDR